MTRRWKLMPYVCTLAVCFGVAAIAEDATGEADAKKLKTHVKQTKEAGAVFTYRQTGGFIGARRLYEQNLSALAEPQRAKLQNLIKDSGLLGVKGEEKLTKGACDVFYYDFTYKDGAVTHHATFDDTTLPESYKPLVAFLKDKVKDEKRPPVESNQAK